MSEELKPCPACGSPATIHPFAGTVSADRWVFCSADKKCTVHEYMPTKEAAIQAWNNFYCWKEIVRLQSELSTANEKIEKAREIFEELKKHNEIVSGNAIHYSANYRLVKEGLAALGEKP